MSDRMFAADRLAKHLGMYIDRVHLQAELKVNHEEWLKKIEDADRGGKLIEAKAEEE